MATTSTATTHWEGSLTEGQGRTALSTSGVATFDVSWGKRAEAGAGTTNPEELLAAALATCYTMALSHGLTQGGNPPESIDTTVGVDFTPGVGVTGAAITVTASVPGLTSEQFAAAAEDTKENCPVSKALAGVEKTLQASLR